MSGLFGGRSEGQLRVTNLYRTAIQQALQCACVRLTKSLKYRYEWNANPFTRPRYLPN